jgi:ribosomal protein L29
MQHDLPNIARLSARLAADNALVTSCIEQLQQRVDALIQALARADVQELRRISEDLAKTSDACGTDTIRYRAERVCEELKKPNNLRAVRQSVARLIGACNAPRADQPHDDWQI